MSTPADLLAQPLPIDMGNGFSVDRLVVDEFGNPVGLVESHFVGPTGHGDTMGRCTGSIRFDTPEARAAYKLDGAYWQVQSWWPLTVMPSLLCSCGNHGFITDGKWVPV